MDDLISRKTLREEIQSMRVTLGGQDIFPGAAKLSVLGRIDEQPAIEAEPVKRGEWEECDWVEYDGHSECVRYPKAAVRCSKCCNAFKKELLWKDNFCPNCGAKMKG